MGESSVVHKSTLSSKEALNNLIRLHNSTPNTEKLKENSHLHSSNCSSRDHNALLQKHEQQQPQKAYLSSRQYELSENIFRLAYYSNLKEDIKLIREFIQEELEGDINALKTYSFKKVMQNPKYGSNAEEVFKDSPKILKALNRVLFKFNWLIYCNKKQMFGGLTQYVPMKINTDKAIYKYLKVRRFEDLKGMNMNEEDLQAVRQSSELNWTIGNYMCIPVFGDTSKTLKCHRDIMEWDSDDFFNELCLWNMTRGNGDKERFKYFDKDLGNSTNLFKSDEALKEFTSINDLYGYFYDEGIAKVNYCKAQAGLELTDFKAPSIVDTKRRIQEYASIHDNLIKERSEHLICLLKRILDGQEKV